MNVSWLPGDLKIYENYSDPLESWIFTMARIITLIMAIIVHRAFYKLMKRLPGRAVNEIIYPNMVSKGSFNNYVDQNVTNFDPLPPDLYVVK